RQRAGGRAGRILRIVQTAQRADAAESSDLTARAPRCAPDGFMLDVDAVGKRRFHRHSHHALAGVLDPLGDAAAPSVVDAYNSGAMLLHAGDQALLEGGIVVERAMA